MDKPDGATWYCSQLVVVSIQLLQLLEAADLLGQASQAVVS